MRPEARSRKRSERCWPADAEALAREALDGMACRSAADATEERRRAAEEHGDAAAKVCPRAELAQDRASIEQHVPAGDDSADRHRPRCLPERVPRGSDPLRRRGDCKSE